ncbi:MAG: hypothetical protein EAY81_12445, partial [Bacteroidetes bacterium]
LDNLKVDNIDIDGNTISATNANGNVELTPNGSGAVILDGQYWPTGSGTNGQILTTNGSGQTAWTSPASSSFTLVGNTGTDLFNTGDSLIFSGVGAISTDVTDDTISFSVADATSTTKGVASFSALDFTVTSGAVSLNDEHIQDLVGTMVTNNTETGISVTYDDDNGKLNFAVNNPVITITGDADGSATMTNLGNTSIAITLDTVNTNTGTFGSTTAVPVLTVNGKGLVTSVSTASISTSFTIAADNGTPDVFNNGETLNIVGGEGIDTLVSASTNTITISAENASDINKGVATFNTASFSVSNGDVTIKNPIKQQDNLLEAKHVYIGFNLFDIVRKNYRVKLISIDSASLNLIIDKSGKVNFDILKRDSEKEQKNEVFLLELKKVVFSHVQVVYLNKQSKQHHQANVHNMELTGNFSSMGEEVACKGNFDLVKSDEALTRLIKGKTIALDLAFKINHNTATYTFAKGFVDIDKLQLSLSGQLQKKPKGLNCDVKIGARNLDIPSLLSLFPLNNKIANDYTSKGSLYFTGTIIGEYNQQVSPAINLEFGIEDGLLSNNAEISLKDISLKGSFSNGKLKSKSSSSINLNNFSFKLNNDEVKGRASINNFNEPMIDVNLVGQLEASEVIKFSKSNWVKSANGNVVFNIDFKGKISDLEKKNFAAVNSAGKFSVNLSDIKFESVDRGINKLAASFAITSKDVLIEQFAAQINESDVKITGKLNN